MRISYLYYLLLLSVLAGCRGDFPVNWTRTFDSSHTIPYGTYVLRKELPEIFQGVNIEDIKINTGRYFDEFYDDYDSYLYVFINDGPHYSRETWNKIFDFVQYGGAALVAMHEFDSLFYEKLQIKTAEIDTVRLPEAVSISINKSDYSEKYIFEKGVGTTYFSEFDAEYTDVLGYVEFKGEQQPDFIKVYHGSGYFLLHSEPIAFTNYHLLKKNLYHYVLDVLSYVEPKDIIWDNYRIHPREQHDDGSGGFFSALNFIMKNESLKWAFFLLLGLGLSYLIFNSKRRQRAVPIVLPYSNHTLDFAKTLSELYRYNPDHTAITKYKINYFQEQIRINYQLTIKDSEENFAQLLSSKSGVDRNFCRRLINKMLYFKSKSYLDKEDFIKLQSLIETFNQKSKKHGRTNPGK